jgi:hypothetical protein
MTIVSVEECPMGTTDQTSDLAFQNYVLGVASRINTGDATHYREDIYDGLGLCPVTWGDQTIPVAEIVTCRQQIAERLRYLADAVQRGECETARLSYVHRDLNEVVTQTIVALVVTLV